MKTIHKFRILDGVGGLATSGIERGIEMPTTARVLSVAIQNGALCVWCEVNTTDPHVSMRSFGIFGTGKRVIDGPLTYAGTVHAASGCVWHVYEIL